MKIQGRVRVVVRDATGRLVRVIRGSNLVVTTGLNTIAEIVRTNNGSTAAPSHLAAGTDATVPAAGQTALIAESGVIARAALSVSRANNVLTYSATLIGGASAQLVKEMGLFNAGVGGTMFARFLPSEFTLETGGTAAVTWALTFGD